MSELRGLTVLEFKTMMDGQLHRVSGLKQYEVIVTMANHVPRNAAVVGSADVDAFVYTIMTVPELPKIRAERAVEALEEACRQQGLGRSFIGCIQIKPAGVTRRFNISEPAPSPRITGSGV